MMYMILHVHVHVGDVVGQGHKSYHSVSMWPDTTIHFHPKLLVRKRDNNMSPCRERLP
jgi:hypothetical protein